MVEARRRAAGGSDFTTLTAMEALANVYGHLRRYDRAEAVARELLAALEALGHRNSGYHSVRSQLGRALVCQGKYAEAEPMLLDVYEQVSPTESRSDGLPRTSDFAASSLYLLYTETGRSAEAARWRAKLPPGYDVPRSLAPPPRPAGTMPPGSSP